MLLERAHALAHAEPTDFDDAYMYLRYAHNALAGQWLVWNPGEAPVYGVTSLLHLAVVTMIRGWFPQLGEAAVLQLASGLAALLLLAALAALCARACRDDRLRGNVLPWSAVLLFLLGRRDAFFFHAHSGMDTMLAALANAGVAFAALWLAERPSTARAVTAAIVGLIAVEARPDDVIIAVLCPLLALALLAPPPRRRATIVWAVTLAGLLVVAVTLEWHLLGTPLPLAFYAKQPRFYGGFAGEFTWNPFLFLEVALGTVTPFLVAILLLARRSTARVLVVLLVPAVATLAAQFSVIQIMGHLGRFFFPSLPLLVVAGALATDRSVAELPARFASADGRTRVARSLLFRGMGVMLALGIGAWALEAAGRLHAGHARTQALAPIDGYRVASATPLPEMDSWQASQEIAALAAAAPSGTTLALTEHGLVGARAPGTTLIDVVGLHDATFARGGFSAGELWRRRPDLIWMPHPDYTQMLHDILASDELWRHYVLYPDAFTYGVALRRDGPRYATLAALFSDRWRAAYPGLRRDDFVASRPSGTPAAE